ncbi:MAG: protein kinase [Myxococcales bacterium]|nr:protein kinase [Myxococcales bacterium]
MATGTKICPTCKLRHPQESTVCLVHRVPLVIEQDPYLGAVIAGKYRIEGVIGAGGMATVYAAQVNASERRVAVKIFRKELSSDVKLRERFRRESSSTRRLAHRNVVEILDEGTLDDNTPFLVMEYLEGQTLEALLKRERAGLSVERTIDLGLQLAAGLGRAHDFQVIHRDLKPENLFLVHDAEGHELLKILDFGIARSMADTRLTATGEIFGTPQYMAPERITSTEAGPSADLYAVGCILFRCATGRLPFQANDVTSFLIQHLREPAPSALQFNPRLPQELDGLILQLLQKEPARRPVDAHAVERVLLDLQARFARPRVISGSFRSDTVKGRDLQATSVGGIFSDDAVERWGRRTDVLGRMLAKAFPSVAPVALSGALGRMRATVTAMGQIQSRWRQDQTRADAIAQRTKESQARFGRAMDALASDQSQARQAALQAGELLAQHEAHVANVGEAFRALHRELVGTGAMAVPDASLLDLYRIAMRALEPVADAGNGLARAREYHARCEAEVRDLAFQIEALRAQLEKASLSGEDEERAVQQRLETAATQLAQMEGALVKDATEITQSLRGRSELDALFREFEADAA